MITLMYSTQHIELSSTTIVPNGCFSARLLALFYEVDGHRIEHNVTLHFSVCVCVCVWCVCPAQNRWWQLVQSLSLHTMNCRPLEPEVRREWLYLPFCSRS